jgi:hypothetical protein
MDALFYRTYVNINALIVLELISSETGTGGSVIFNLTQPFSTVNRCTWINALVKGLIALLFIRTVIIADALYWETSGVLIVRIP